MDVPVSPASVGTHRAAWLFFLGWKMWIQALFVGEEKAQQHKGRGCALPA